MKSTPANLFTAVQRAFADGSVSLPNEYGFCVDQMSPPPRDRMGQLRGGDCPDPSNHEVVREMPGHGEYLDLDEDWADTRVYIDVYDQRDKGGETAILVHAHVRPETDADIDRRTWLVDEDAFINNMREVFERSTADDWDVWRESPLLDAAFAASSYEKRVHEHAT